MHHPSPTTSAPFQIVLDNFPLWVGPLLCYLGYISTCKMIMPISKYLLKRGIYGRNIHHPNRIITPESLGIVPGTIFVILVIFLEVFYFMPVEFNAAVTSILFMLYLGFVDDILELPWRYKLAVPTVAALPLLLAYKGQTAVLLPVILRGIFGQTYLDLGFLYVWGFMLAFAIFCTNSINIYAGVNGLEVGQSLVISAFVIIFNCIEMYLGFLRIRESQYWTFDSHSSDALKLMIQHDPIAVRHVFSLLLMLPFFGTSLGLYKFNKFPSKVFVGDSYTTFAGMTFAVVGILGHFSKTMLFFFVPQIINFLLSFPQVIGLIPCDRHRLPVLDKKTMLLHPQWRHWNLLNKIMYFSGPLSERDACNLCLYFQIATSLVGLTIRYGVAPYFF